MKRISYNGDRGFRTVNASIHGFQQCCSAAILHGVGGYRQTVVYPDQENGHGLLQYIDQTPAESFADWQKRFSHKNNVFLMPWDHAMCAVLEQLYNKARTGHGGNNMYASQTYATKTWFMADRRRTDWSMSCMNFMNWLKEQGVSKVGRIHISPYRPGAHGGECKGAVYAPNLKKIEELLAEKLEELNEHAAWVFDYYKVKPVLGAGATDAVGALW